MTHPNITISSYWQLYSYFLRVVLLLGAILLISTLTTVAQLIRVANTQHKLWPHVLVCLCIGDRIYFARQDGKRRHLVLNEAIPAYLWLPSSADFLSLDVLKEINRIMGMIIRKYLYSSMTQFV